MRNCNEEFLSWRNKLTFAGLLVVIGGSLNIFTLLSYVSSSFFVAGQKEGVLGFIAQNYLLFYLLGIVASALVVFYGIYSMVFSDRLLVSKDDLVEHFKNPAIFIFGLVASIVTVSVIAIIGAVLIIKTRKEVLANPDKFRRYTEEFRNKEDELNELIERSKNKLSVDSLTIPGVYNPSERMVFLDFLRNLNRAGMLFMIGGGAQLLIAFLNFAYLFPNNNYSQSMMYMIASVVSMIFGKIVLNYAEKISGRTENIIRYFKSNKPFFIIIALAIITSSPITMIAASYLLLSQYTVKYNMPVFEALEAEQAAMDQSKVKVSADD